MLFLILGLTVYTNMRNCRGAVVSPTILKQNTEKERKEERLACANLIDKLSHN